jgi:hypothetical protein
MKLIFWRMWTEKIVGGGRRQIWLGQQGAKSDWSWLEQDHGTSAATSLVLVVGTHTKSSYDLDSISSTAGEILGHLVRQSANPIIDADATVKLDAASIRSTQPFYDTLWIMPPAAGFNKPVEWVERQGNPVIRNLYQGLLPMLQELQVPAFERFNHTVSAESYDGTHFGLLPNLEQAMVVLNWLRLD